MADRGEMHPNLVGAPRLEPQLNVGCLERLGEVGQHAVMRSRLAAGGGNRHPRRISKGPADRCVDDAGVGVERAASERKVGPPYRARRQLGVSER